MNQDNPHIGSTFDNFLQEQGIAEEVNAAAIKRVLAWQIEESMEQQGIRKNQMAKRMHTAASTSTGLSIPTTTRCNWTRCK